MTAHEHSYERTYLMSDFENHIIATTNRTLNIQPGKTYATVSGLGGDSIRSWKNGNHLYSWWAALSALDTGTNYGALLCTFNKGGNLKKAKCHFTDIDGEVWDEYTVYSHPNEKAIEPRKMDSPRLKFLEVPILEANDIMTMDVTMGELECAPQTLFFPSIASTRKLRHALTFRNVPLPSLKSRLVSANVQMMGSHPSKALVDLVGRPKALSIMNQISVDSLNVSIGIIEGHSGCNVREGGKVRGALKIRKELGKVDLASRVDNEWEAGEVWVSPDISSIIQRAFSSAQRDSPDSAVMDLVLILEGQSAQGPREFFEGLNGFGDSEKGVYGADANLRMCTAPTLVLQFHQK
jgi:hypothetical protein